MVLRQNLKADSTDTLRNILNQAQTLHTRPFGQKAATADEGIDYTTSTGQAIRWDGDTVADYDRRITEGQQAIAEATADLAEAEGNINAAKDRIAAVEADTTPEAIGTTAAGQINSRRLIVGRDAILTGTVDVAQLNVTEQMSAAVVDAMSVDAKKLVVTEDAILNRATIVQSLVTPELVADRINVRTLGAKLVTSGALQTDTASNVGVKIDTNGYRAYDASGNLAVDLNGKSNLMVGSFQTNIAGKTGVRISGRNSISAIDLYSADAGTTGQGTLGGAHGFAFFSSPTSLGSTNLAVGAMNRETGLNDDDPQIVFRPIGKTISFNGKFDSFGSGFQSGQLTGGQISAGGYIDWTVTFAKALPAGSRPIVLVSPVAASKVELAYVITEDSTTGFKLRVVNKSGNTTPAVWIKWIAFAATAD